MDRILYIHGKNGSPDEADFYAPLFPDWQVCGMAYHSDAPWQAREEFPAQFDALCGGAARVILIANSIGAFFAMHSLADKPIERAYFISPIVDMKRLILDMMQQAGVTEDALAARGEIETDFGETLSYAYLRDVREHPVTWKIPTEILFGEKDELTRPETVADFARKTGAGLTVMPGGTHWFHTAEQMRFLKNWLGRQEV